jgi:hypothetical protein
MTTLMRLTVISETNKYKLRAWLGNAGVLIGFIFLCFANTWVFKHFFDINYFEWYINSGPFIALAITAFSLAWPDIENNSALFSARPLDYVGSWLQLTGLPLFTVGGHFSSKNHNRPIGMDFFPAMILALILVAGFLGWLILVLPVQYGVFLIAGSLPRIIIKSNTKVFAKMKGTQLHIIDDAVISSDIDSIGFWDASMRDRPLTLTNAFAATILYLLGLLW